MFRLFNIATKRINCQKRQIIGGTRGSTKQNNSTKKFKWRREYWSLWIPDFHPRIQLMTTIQY